MAFMQPVEIIICEAKRHPIGIIGVYIVAFILLLTGGGFVLYFVPPILSSSGSSLSQTQAAAITTLLLLGIAVLVVAFLSLVTYVYWQNRWVVTSDSITQVQQNGIFQRQMSQLSLANLEDITVEQNGVLPSMFNYGTLRAETAGERSKFYLTFSANPNTCAKEILMARENFVNGHPEGEVKQSSPQPTINQTLYK